MRIVICLFAVLFGQNIEIANFEELSSHIDEGTLIILDIDDTLLVPSQMLGCDEWFLNRLEKFPKSFEKVLQEWRGIRELSQMKLVEEGTEKLISSLQDEGYTIMGLTSQDLDLSRCTINQLKENDINLSVTAPLSDDYFVRKDLGVLYRKGILFTSGTPKGEALFTLFERGGYKPKRIVFVNDKAAHLVDVGKEAINHDVEFLGLRYGYTDQKKAAFSPELSDFELTHSTLDHFLSDEEANALISKEE